MLIAQISDTHIKPEGGSRTAASTRPRFSRAPWITSHLDPRTDVVLGTGDLVDGGTREEYTRLRHLLSRSRMPSISSGQSRRPVKLTPDLLGLPVDASADGFIQYVVEDGPLRLIAVDTGFPARPAAARRRRRLARSAAREAPTKPTMIFCTTRRSRPPSTTWMGSVWRAPTRWPTSCARHPRSSAGVCGHSIARSVAVGGTLGDDGARTAHQVGLELREPAAGLDVSWSPPATRSISGGGLGLVVTWRTSSEPELRGVRKRVARQGRIRMSRSA